METTEYVTTKEKCQKQCDGLVCTGCGKPITPIETVDNSNRPTFWPGCLDCSQFNYGATIGMFLIARRLVEKYNFIAYRHMESPDGKNQAYKDYWISAQTSGAVSLIREIYACTKEIDEETKQANP